MPFRHYCHTGMLQVSVLGPLLLSCNISPIGSLASSFCVNTQQYADDTQVYISLTAKTGSTESHRHFILVLSHWSRSSLNSSKSESILFTARCYAERGIAMASCLSVCLSVTLRYCDYKGWKSSKIISWLVSLGCSLFATPTSRGYSKGNTPKFLPE